MRQIPVVGSSIPALVDSKDYDSVSKYRWVVQVDVNTSYAKRPGCFYMHRDIHPTKAGNYVDHINGNGLDNRRCNLREATSTQSHGNTVKRDGCKSIYKGVCRAEGRWRWTSYINCNGVRTHLGQYDTQEEAAIAYNEAAVLAFGEFAKLNIIQ